ncbi:MAG: 2OG-Fe(II) oxygenase [Phenylobacterium sp.]|jgi:prolyl 4-hydroxylase|uniref:2OG-Fe(II) oxygenase n=1 Tax=Phenylobacterium sp. TaxID=1871053 RepID=UPI001B45AD77|nr:2OG-Fe(II) oxygenase [Phenylobacterium sp.]MBP7650275.1 2OG-Fe(II) oxygenase [Phenylobacterium sp.]MBP7815932.1 2OG-Fe(II) oxygenase [Phenylobacterium sp.]MBP9230118.1 2OG-Fe(II) oxygenase [Phenylobacterium sp.]MBP9756698.1 2OG-Fe(II) oxygenase [Phenylobacterium sp.]
MALAEALDSQGQGKAALDWMVRAAHGGWMPAVSRLGLWQLVGHITPQAPALGVGRIIQAAQAGDPFGLHLAAIVDSGAIGTPRNIGRALFWLARAAQLGDGRAACQLGLLCGDRKLAHAALSAAAITGFEPAIAALGARGVIPAPTDWDAVAAAADLSDFAAPVSRVVESESPRILSIPSLLPTWICAYVRALAEPALGRGLVLVDDGGEEERDERSNRVMHFGLVDSDVILELVNLRLSQAAEMPPENAEGLGVLHYSPGERYRPHMDYIPDTPANAQQLAVMGQRVRTLLVYLNDAFEGGATVFPRLEAAFRPPPGGALIFDSVTPEGEMDPRTLHEGSPPTSGEKWVISRWFRTKALRPTAS